MSERIFSSHEFDDIVPFENLSGRNDRFTYAKVRIGDEWYFRKEAKTPELHANLQREALWSEYVTDIIGQGNRAHITAPKIFGFDQEGALLSEFIDAPFVCPPDDSSYWISQLDRYADMLAVLDEYSQNNTITWPDSSKLNSIKNIDTAWPQWLGSYADKVPRLEEAKAYIKAHIPTLPMTIQHGDLTPWQMFNKGSDWVIFDGEKAGNHLPRFNDLCYAYGRLYTRFHEREAARQLLRLFIEKTGVNTNDFEAQLMPVMLFRVVGMIGDTAGDGDASSLKDALDLYERCLSGSLDQLIKS